MNKSHKIQTKNISDEEILEAVRLFQSKKADTPDISLAHKYPVKVILAKMQKLVDKGVLDYGVSLRTAYLKRR